MCSPGYRPPASEGFALATLGLYTYVWGGLSLTGEYTNGLHCIQLATGDMVKCISHRVESNIRIGNHV